MTEQVQAHILKKYELLAYLGKGAYGIVWKAIDKQTKKIVAIKKVFDAFHNATDAQRTFRQVMFLQGLKNHENIVSLEGLIKAQNNKDIYLVFGFMDSDLHHVIRGNLLEEVHRQYVIYQILKGIKYIHTGDIMHRDLKPANILLDQNCFVKVADFGLARSTAQQDQDTVMTDYVATRWYRAPEILFGSEKYTKSVDMWSVGCILAEMFIGKPLFAGTTSLNQIQRVLEVIGRPSWEDIQSMESNATQTMLEQITFQKKKSFNQLFPNASDEAIDLMKKLLIMNPNKRLSVHEALRHPYFKDFSNPIEQIQCPKAIEIPMDDNTKFSTKEYRQALYQQILKKKRQEDEARRLSFQKQQQKIKRQYKLQRNQQGVSRERQQSKKQQRRDILKYEKQNSKYRDYDKKSISREKVGPKQSTVASRYIQKSLNQNNTSTINTRADKSKTYYYINDKDYYKLGSSYLDKSIGQATNNRKTQTTYGKISTFNHPYRKR